MVARNRWLRVIGIAGLVLALIVAFVPSVFAATAASFTIVNMQEDHIYNYDMLNTQYAGSTNVDWPVTMLFTNNANIDYVKISIYYGISGSSASPMYGRFNDGPGYIWDQDSGTKSSVNCLSNGVKHMRVYATPYPYDHNYNLTWGYYVYGTTHFDKYECSDGRFGWSEDAEHDFALRAVSKHCVVAEDSVNFQNPEPFRIEGGNHVWQNGGYATRVQVTGSCGT